MSYIIIRGERTLGPFDENDILQFISEGLVLEREKAIEINHPDVVSTIGELLRKRGLKPKVKSAGNIFSQLKDIGKELIIPKSIFTKKPWQEDGRLIILAVVGLSLSLLVHIASGFSPEIIFYLISLYFALIWGLFFYYLFCTEQVKLKTTVLTLFATQLVTYFLFFVLNIGDIFSFSDSAYTGNVFVSMFSCSIGIGIPEELTKLLPILFILLVSKQVLTPQTMVYYGLMSGIAFGIFEGVKYQMGVNYVSLLIEEVTPEAYTETFLLNVSRLTALPFLHAIWCAIGSYFVACAFVYPRYKASLFCLALLIPALLHGIYDSFCFKELSILCIPIIIIAVVLLMVYLNKHHELENTLA